MSDGDMPPENFNEEERRVLGTYVTDVDGPVFALVGMPEVVKAALFARYSRSPKTLRRLFIDEFADPSSADDLRSASSAQVGVGRADQLHERVFVEYGDDSVAQLAGVHIAVEGASNILTKILEWGRLMSYLEQSTRYVPYTDKPGGHWRYHLPRELSNHPLRTRYAETLDEAFEIYTKWFNPLQTYLKARFQRQPDDSVAAYNASIRAKACDILRGLLPAATTSNVGLYGSAQAYEALLLRLRHHPLGEARVTGDRILAELRKVIPVFMRRVDQPERGEVWSSYLHTTSASLADLTRELIGPGEEIDSPSVTLTDFDPAGELKVVVAALYPFSSLSESELLDRVQRMPPSQHEAILRKYAGVRANRRHKPGRAFERTSYRFDIVADYGAFRDLQRHRMLTIEWQPLSPGLGYETPDEIGAINATADWRRVMTESLRLYEDLRTAGLSDVAPYAVSMAYRIRFYMQMNAREAMHVIELRTSDQAHPNYRRICLEMLRLIREEAGHNAIASTMLYAGTSEPRLERLASEQRNETRRQKAAGES